MPKHRATRRLFVAGLAAALTLLTAGVGGSAAMRTAAGPDSTKATTITIWGWGVAVDGLKLVDEGFRKKYPDIELKYVVRSPTETYRQIQLTISAGSGAPDVSLVEDSHLAQLVKLGALADVTSRVRPYRKLIAPYRWKEATRNGRIHAMPWDSGPVAVFYRRDIFQRAGVNPNRINTWAQYYQAALKIKRTTGVPMWPQPTARNDARVFEILLWQQGLGYVNGKGAVILDKDARIRRTLEFMGKFWKGGLSLNQEWWTNPWYKAFEEGEVATIPEAVWMGTFFKSFIAPKAVGKWGVFRLPAWTPGGSRASNDGGSALAIFNQSDNKAAAWNYIQYHLGRADVQVQIYEKTDLFPGLTTAYRTPLFKTGDPYFGGQRVRELFVDIARKIPKAGVYSSDYQQMNSLMQTEIQKYALGRQTARQALSNAARAIRQRTRRP
jgi:ABC-type glycerol-3-phosphate transport system substrate-binding protein